MQKPIRWSAICSLWKIYNFAYYTKLLQNLLLHVNNSHEINIWNFWKCACPICNLHFCFNFALLFYENALIFSQLEAHNFFMYIISVPSAVLFRWSVVHKGKGTSFVDRKCCSLSEAEQSQVKARGIWTELLAR